MKEFIKAVIIKVYQFTYWILSFFIKENQYDVVIIAKHNNNIINYIKMNPDEIIGGITNNKSFRNFLEKYPKTKKVIAYEEYNIFSAVQQIIMILQTDKIVIDDYYAPLYGIDASKEIWNIWHSYAIYKKIGLDSPIYNNKSNLAVSRYRRNYKRINKLFVRSEIEKKIFMNSYNVTADKIIIDESFYRSQYADISRSKQKHKKIVYAPTFRSYKYDFMNIYHKIQEQFPNYEVVINFHPITLKDYPALKTYHNKNSIANLLENAEIFITDYSGLLIEIADLYQDIKVYQVIDKDDYHKYLEINGINNDVYKQNYEILEI